MTDQAPVPDGQGAPPPLPPVPDGNPTAPNPIPWLEGADELTVGYVQNKGWTEPKQVLEVYRNLEKVFHADRAGNTVILPKPDATPAEIEVFFNKLGRPAEPAGYNLKVPDAIGDPEFAKAAAAKMHELGLTQKQGEAIGQWWNSQGESLMAKVTEQKTQTFQADDQALKAGWGMAFDQNVQLAKAAANALGVTEAHIDGLSAVIGHKATMEFFHKIGTKTGEADFVSGNSSEKFGSQLTPGQAKAKIQELRQDKNWFSRYINKDVEAVAEFKKLHEFAYPEEK